MRIKHAVESAKIELSTKDRTTLGSGISFEDAAGETIDCDEIVITREDLIKVAEPLISRSVEISRRVLKEKNLGLQAVQRVIVVGGPTKATYFREMLGAGLGIPIDFSQDPLTVLVRGAAVFAGTQKLDIRLQKKAAVGEFQIQISDKYEPVGHDAEPLIAGKVTSPENASTSGFSIEFVNRDTKWHSGQILLNGEGAFMANLMAEKGLRSTFHIELSNRKGSLQKVVPDHVVYTIGAVIEEQPLLKSIGLGRADNSVDWYFKAGAGLPQKKRWPSAYRTTVAVKAGQPGRAITFSIVEGEDPCADRNRVVGVLVIDSSMVRQDLPAGSEVEITLKMSESRAIVLEVYFPLLDEEFTKQLDVEKQGADPAEIAKNHTDEKKRLRELKKKAEEAGDSIVVQELEHLESDRDLKDAVRAAKGDPAEAEKAQARLLELQKKLDAAEEKLKWPTLVAEARELQVELTKLTDDHGNNDQKARAEEWSVAIDSIIDKKQTDRLPRKVDEGRSIYCQVVVSLPDYGEWEDSSMKSALHGDTADDFNGHLSSPCCVASALQSRSQQRFLKLKLFIDQLNKELDLMPDELTWHNGQPIVSRPKLQSR